MSPWTSFGTAPLALFIAAALSGAFILIDDHARETERPDLVFAVFSKQHQQDYERILPAFEARHGVKVQLLLTDAKALLDRLRAAMAVGAEVPDCFEMFAGNLGAYTAGPVQDVQLLDLTDRVRATGLDKTLVANRFGLWSAHGRIWAVPHDVHPMMLAYRKDLFAAIGEDPRTATTWEAFAAMGRRISVDLDGDGMHDRFMLDLPKQGHDTFAALLMQAGGRIFDEAGRPQLDSATTAAVAEWYIRALYGPQRFAYAAGWGQPFARAMGEGLVWCIMLPDWRTRMLESELPALAGKWDLMPLPAWHEGGARTSTMGGTGFFITRHCRDAELAWKLMEHLYTDTADLGSRFLRSNILPPVRAAWSLPELNQVNAYWSLPIGASFAALAEGLPDYRTPPHWNVGLNELDGALIDLGVAFQADPGMDLRAGIRVRLAGAQEAIRRLMDRNRFQQVPP